MSTDASEPAQSFLLQAAKGLPTDSEIDACRRLLTGALPWEEILTLAGRHEVSPLVHANLRRLEWRAVPDHVRAEFSRRFTENGARNALLSQELARVLEAFSEAGLPALPFKGPALAERLYGDPGLRSCLDLDVLVPRDQVASARDLLKSLGYRTAPYFKTPLAAALSDPDCFELPMVRVHHGFEYLLEIHWGLMWGDPIRGGAMAHLWETARPSHFAGVPTQAMSPEWNLIALCAHAARHHWERLKWLVDIHDTCVQGRIDWDLLENLLDAVRWRRTVLLTLGVCRAVLDTPVSIPVDTPYRWSVDIFRTFRYWQTLRHRWLLIADLIPRPSGRLRYLAGSFLPKILKALRASISVERSGTMPTKPSSA